MKSLFAAICFLSASSAFASSTNLGPIIKNQGNVIESKHMLGPVIKNQGGVVEAKHNLGPIIKNQGNVVEPKHEVKAETLQSIDSNSEIVDLNKE